MFVLDLLSFLPVPSTLSAFPFAYAGPGVYVQFISYFFSLLAMVGVALSAVLMWPVYTLLRWLRGGKAKPPVEAPVAVPANQAVEGVSHS
jgi:hypothetical protein